jgi:endonuclease-8
MEGPSLYLAAEQLQPFVKKRINGVAGNTKIGKERLDGLVVQDIFSWGKHLVFQFDGFAVRIHFLLFGTFEAQVDDVWVTGDYRRARESRLSLAFDNGVIHMYNCSVKFIEDAHAKRSYDFSIDIMSKKWDPARPLAQMREQQNEEIADVLLDQEIFAGVGNIIKNEILSIARVNPKTTVAAISPAKLKEIIKEAQGFSKKFLAWRKKFELRKRLLAHGRGVCPHCGGKLIKQKTGKKQRWSYWCQECQKEPS